MIDVNKKCYFTFDSSRPSEFLPFSKCYYYMDIGDPSGDKCYSQDEIKKIENHPNRFNQNLLQRILRMREGTIIKICYIHSRGDFCIRLLTKKEKEEHYKIESLREQLEVVKQKIKEYVPPELFK